MMIDSSSLAKLVLKEEGWERVAELLEESGDAATLDFAVVEVANAVWKHTVLPQSFDLRTAREKIEVLLLLVDGGVVSLLESRRYLRRAFEIAAERRITVYDALFIAAALEANAVLVTSDARQAEAARESGARVELVA